MVTGTQGWLRRMWMMISQWWRWTVWGMSNVNTTLRMQMMMKSMYPLWRENSVVLESVPDKWSECMTWIRCVDDAE